MYLKNNFDFFFLQNFNQKKNYLSNEKKNITVAQSINSKRCSLKEYGKLTNVDACKIMLITAMRSGINVSMCAICGRCEAAHFNVCERSLECLRVRVCASAGPSVSEPASHRTRILRQESKKKTLIGVRLQYLCKNCLRLYFTNVSINGMRNNSR